MVVRLNQEWMIFQNIQQEVFRRIHYDHDSFSFQTRHDLFIHVIRHGRWNASCQKKYISLSQHIQLLHQFFYFILADHRSCTVNLRSINGFQFHIDSGNTLLDLDEIRFHTHLLKSADNFFSHKSCGKTECCISDSQIHQHCGNIDSLSTRKHQL